MADAKAAHTPGPWRWAEDRMNGGWAGLVGPDGQEVMFPAHRNEGDDGDAWFEPGESMSDADARLIEAAPDLLAALRAARSAIDCVREELDEHLEVGTELYTDLAVAGYMADEAIAKADGGDDGQA